VHNKAKRNHKKKQENVLSHCGGAQQKFGRVSNKQTTRKVRVCVTSTVQTPFLLFHESIL